MRGDRSGQGRTMWAQNSVQNKENDRCTTVDAARACRFVTGVGPYRFFYKRVGEVDKTLSTFGDKLATTDLCFI